MSTDKIIPFDESILKLPSCLTVHAQLRSNLTKLTSEDYVKCVQPLRICGIIREIGSEKVVVALAVYHQHLSTFDTVRFEIDDIVVDEKERKHGLGTNLLHYLVDQAKQSDAKQILIHCDLLNSNAHHFFFRFGLTIIVFEFYLQNFQLFESDRLINVIDMTDLSEHENEQLLIQAHEIYRQLRPHLPTDHQTYIKQIRDICRTGPARIIIAISNNQNKEIIGLALYRICSNVKYSSYIYCDDLVTDENKRSTGVGRCLINYMKEQAEKLGIKQLILDSGCQRGRAHKFYHKEGFIINQFGFSMTI